MANRSSLVYGALGVRWAIFPVTALFLVSPPAEGSIARIDAGQTILAFSDLARVGQTDGRAAADVAVGAAGTEEAFTGWHVWHTVGTVGSVVAYFSGRTADVGAAQWFADSAGGFVFAPLVVFALLSFTRLWNAHLTVLYFTNFILSAFLGASLILVSGGFSAVLATDGGHDHQQKDCSTEHHGAAG